MRLPKLWTIWSIMWASFGLAIVIYALTEKPGYARTLLMALAFIIFVFAELYKQQVMYGYMLPGSYKWIDLAENMVLVDVVFLRNGHKISEIDEVPNVTRDAATAQARTIIMDIPGVKFIKLAELEPSLTGQPDRIKIVVQPKPTAVFENRPAPS